MKKITLLTTFILLMTMLGCTTKHRLCSDNEIGEPSDVVLLNWCVDETGEYAGLINDEGDIFVPHVYSLIDEGNSSVSLMSVPSYSLDQTVNFYRLIDVNKKNEYSFGMFSKENGVIVDVIYDNLFINHQEQLAYYNNQEVNYMHDLVTNEITEVDYFVYDVINEKFIYRYDELYKVKLSDGVIDIMTDDQLIYIDDYYYVLTHNNGLEFYDTENHNRIYEISGTEFDTYTVNVIGDDYLITVSSSLLIKEVHNPLLSTSINNSQGYMYLFDGSISYFQNGEIEFYNSNLKMLQTIGNVDSLKYGNNFIYTVEQNQLLQNILSGLEVSYNSEGYFRYNNVIGICDDFKMMIYDEQLTDLAQVDNCDVRWFIDNDTIKLITSEQASVTVYSDSVIVVKVASEIDGLLSTTTFGDGYFYSSEYHKSIYVIDNKVLIINKIDYR